MHRIELRGLDGSNLLGYLAALGTLRVLTGAKHDVQVRMSWEDIGWWTPVVHHTVWSTKDELVASLAERLREPSGGNEAWNIGRDLTLKLAEYRALIESARHKADPGNRDLMDYLAAFGSEAYASGPQRGQMSDTEFRTMSGAGHQHFLGFMNELAIKTTVNHVRRALFEQWDYADDRPSLRWDPADYRPHALRAEDPSGDPIRTMQGANRLAVEALPLFPTVPLARCLATVGFSREEGETVVRWPIWTDQLDLGSVRSLLAMDLREADSLKLKARGVEQVFQAVRFTEGKYRNFSPARALL
jgi:hypothetical protein